MSSTGDESSEEPPCSVLLAITSRASFFSPRRRARRFTFVFTDFPTPMASKENNRKKTHNEIQKKKYFLSSTSYLFSRRPLSPPPTHTPLK